MQVVMNITIQGRLKNIKFDDIFSTIFNVKHQQDIITENKKIELTELCKPVTLQGQWSFASGRMCHSVRRLLVSGYVYDE
ncbi:hypothetical protein CHS0354_006692 [Potamilus streckersoni]|uniref:Uncharacterized protein n=1 Tax=Potamilus streckersoni TaxID=2493646 RepID=A0AAE0W432_9BIVA|nr:hypothetical protein CHS0354_006692 [Potamilus streckersoni]